MTKYEEAKCKCGWYCLVLKETQSSVYHCGLLLTKTAGGKEEANE